MGLIRRIIAGFLAWGVVFSAGAAVPRGRFQVMGDGILTLTRGKGVVSVRYRGPDGSYLADGLRTLHSLFGTSYDRPSERVELRLIELLDAVQDHFGGRAIVLRSGFRSPVANNSLRRQGKLAGQSSMHIEGGAADFHLAGVSSAEVAAYARALAVGGVGYYHGREVHLDTGPVRQWDEQTSGTEAQAPQRNAKIILQTEFDRYGAGEPVRFRWMRITEFPVVVPLQVSLECERSERAVPVREVTLQYGAGLLHRKDGCVVLDTRAAARGPVWAAAPAARCGGRYQVRVRFCERPSELMPAEVVSNIFQIED